MPSPYHVFRMGSGFESTSTFPSKPESLLSTIAATLNRTCIEKGHRNLSNSFAIVELWPRRGRFRKLMLRGQIHSQILHRFSSIGDPRHRWLKGIYWELQHRFPGVHSDVYPMKVESHSLCLRQGFGVPSQDCGRGRSTRS
jgi:hypothetical protein